MWTIVKQNAIASCFHLLKRNFKTVRNNFKKVLILNKRTRYEIEKVLKPEFTDDQLERFLRKRGSDFDTILRHHNLHRKYYNSLRDALGLYDIELRSVSRNNLSQEAVDWADLVVVAGGDGTFLLAASYVIDSNKTVVGFNSDPSRSEGHLCLPKQHSSNILSSVDKIFQNEFKWLLRNRIEISLTGPRAMEEPVHLDDCVAPRFRQLLAQTMAQNEMEQPVAVTRVLPYLALNEVFLGEILSSQVSYLQVEKGDSQQPVKVKCSGLCVCTGTGSTSWHLSINRLSEKKVELLMKLAGNNQHNSKQLASEYNKSLTFDPEHSMMYYSFRDLIMAGVWPDPYGVLKGGYVDSLQVRSKCFNATLVIDGGCAYSFNDGTRAKFVINPDKALRTISLD